MMHNIIYRSFAFAWTSDRHEAPCAYGRCKRRKNFCVAIVFVLAVLVLPKFTQAESSNGNFSDEQTKRNKYAPPEDVYKALQSTDGHFVLWRGKRHKLCRDFMENLKFLGKVPRHSCEMPIAKQFKDFRMISWESLDPLEHIDIVNEIEVNMRVDRKLSELKTTAEIQEYWAKRQSHALAMARSGSSALGRARFDLNHDGNTDTVYRYGTAMDHGKGKPRCDPIKNPGFGKFGWRYPVRPQDDLGLSNQTHRALTNSFSDAFYYKGRAYLLKSGSYIVEPQTNYFAQILICQFNWYQ